MAYRTYITHPDEGQVKRVVPAPRLGGETPAQRAQRFMTQAAQNRLRIKNLGEGLFQVPTQRRGLDGKPARPPYLVREFVGLGWSCTCEWGTRHALYTPGENDIALCAHIAQCVKYLERQEREMARFTARLVARMEAQAVESVPYVPESGPLAAGYYRDLANAGLAELEGSAA